MIFVYLNNLIFLGLHKNTMQLLFFSGTCTTGNIKSMMASTLLLHHEILLSFLSAQAVVQVLLIVCLSDLLFRNLIKNRKHVVLHQVCSGFLVLVAKTIFFPKQPFTPNASRTFTNLLTNSVSSDFL